MVQKKNKVKKLENSSILVEWKSFLNLKNTFNTAIFAPF